MSDQIDPPDLPNVTRRGFLKGVGIGTAATPLVSPIARGRAEAAPRGWSQAAEVLAQAVRSGQVRSAVLHVAQRETRFTRAFGEAREDSMFLLGSISKPICLTALLKLHDAGEFRLDDRLGRFLPGFKGEGREEVTLRQLMTHTSGLPDQLDDNLPLRRSHAPLAEFVRGATRAPLQFIPGTRYQYSSMGVLLATHVAEIISGRNILDLVDATVLRPLKMDRSAQGLGRFQRDEMVRMQVEFAAPEAGGGDTGARDWDWNSPWWRGLGAPWGGTHASAPDVAKFLAEFLNESGAVLKPETARLAIRNQNPPDITPRGLGFETGREIGGRGCSDQSFGHAGSTGALAWADPVSRILCVIMTSLPERAAAHHPRDLAADAVVAGP